MSYYNKIFISLLSLFFVFFLCPQNANAALPTYKGSGTFTAGTVAITPPFPTGGASPALNDICLLVVESENQAITLSSAQGFAEVTTYSPQSAGTAAVNPGSRLAVFWKRAAASNTAPTVADSGDHTTGQIHCFSGVITTGNPWDIGAGGNDSAANDTSAVIPGATTTTNNALIVLITSTSYNGNSTAQCTGWSNASLANITERTDNTDTSGLGGGHCMATGEKSSLGAYSQTTATLANTSYKGAVSLALKPPIETNIATGADPSSVSVAPNTAIMDAGAFTVDTTTSTDSITALTVTLNTSGTPYDGLSEVRITSDNGSILYFSAISNPRSNSLLFSGGTPVPVGTATTQFKIRITPKTHANMSVPNGASYSLSPYVSAFTSSNTQTGTDSNANAITIDNLSPNSATSVSGSSSAAANTINWTSSSSSDFDTTNGSVVLRWASASAGSETPVEGTSNYSPGNSINTATVACVVSSAISTVISKVDGSGGSAECTSTALTNGQTYTYKVFQRDSSGNYDTGTVIGSFTPVIISVTITSDGTISYGIVPLSGTKNTTATDLNDTQVIKNDGTAAEDFTIKTSNATGGVQWTLGSLTGDNTFVHEFSTNSGGLWTKFSVADSYQTFATNVSANTSQNLDLRIYAPSSSSDYQQKNITVTILATQH